jgi:hypothetical protein
VFAAITRISVVAADRREVEPAAAVEGGARELRDDGLALRRHRADRPGEVA